MKRYNPKEIEPKWQSIWEETDLYLADLKSAKPKYVAMSMFNYPSGAGIHIGHAMNYTISDVKSRYKRQSGYESYHPVGWDSFGLPAENYAIKAGVSPQESMAKIIPWYHKQYKAMGWSNDWEKEIATHKPEYYKWTQWIFTEMFKHGLAYRSARMQWWCDIDKTVLANEQVIDGKCWRHDGPDDPYVERKEVNQWFFKITEYADELLEATNNLNWTESVKQAQKNWIGKSSGMSVSFKLEGLKIQDESVEVYTTAHDTIFGVTFMVVAPEHPLISKYGPDAKNWPEVKKYIEEAIRKSEVDREADKTKTGVAVEGLFAINPINGQKVPVWVADYVLLGYGTGIVMAVPGEDERDYEFAKKYDLPIIYTTEQPEFVNYQTDIKVNPKAYILANSGDFNGLDFLEGRQKIQERLIALNVGKTEIRYKMRDWSVSRQRYWGAPIPIIYCPKCGTVAVTEKDLPVILPELNDFAPTGDGRSALARAKDWLNVSCPKCGSMAERETDTLDTYICSSWYMMRYIDPHNQEAIFDSEVVNKWFPIDFYNGADHATAHLLYARFVTRFFNKIGLMKHPEPFNKMLYNGKVTASDGSPFSKSKGNGIDPLEIINSGYGADALRTYLMFASPLEIGARWDPQGVPGTFRFLTRVWNIVNEYIDADKTELNKDQIKELRLASHAMIKKVSRDLENDRYNTAIAALMTCLNSYYKLKEVSFKKCDEWDEAISGILMCLAPFAPHITEELWQQLGHTSSIHKDNWPKLNEDYLKQDMVTVVIQINGKLRGEIRVDADASEDSVLGSSQIDPKVQVYLKGQTIKKSIYVPGKLVNFVI